MQLRRRAWLLVLCLAGLLTLLQGTGLARGLATIPEAQGVALDADRNQAQVVARVADRTRASNFPAAVVRRMSTALASIENAVQRQVRRALTVRPHGPPRSFDPRPGQGAFRLSIPEIDLQEVVYHGTEQAQLAKGPGHYPACGAEFPPPYCAPFEEVWPGEVGRTVIGGHRTLAGADFLDLGRLARGDTVRIDASWGTFLYEVVRRDIVDPLDRSIIVPGIERRELVLVTCHPKGSAAKRLLYFARLRRALAPERS